MFFGFTALECYVIIVAIFAIIYLFTPRKNIWLPFLVITVLFAALAYNLTPDVNDDLTTYYHHMDIFRKDGVDGLNYALEENWFEWRTYRVSLYYFYLLSKLPNNNYLSAVTIFIVYFLGFYVLYKFSKKFDISKFDLFLASMFFISTYWYYDTASGIRNGLTFAVVFACAYQQFVEKRHILLCYIGYIMAVFMHSSGIVPVILVVITIITYKLSGKFVNFLLFFGLIIGGSLINYLSEITDNSFIQSLALKAEAHVEDTAFSGNTRFYVNITVLVVVILLLLYLSNYISKSVYADDLKKFYKFMSIVISFCVGAIFSHLLFIRFARWILPLIGSILFMLCMKIQLEIENSKDSYGLQNGMFIQKSFLSKIRPLVYIVYIGYTAVSFWYSLNGSSLVWIHF